MTAIKPTTRLQALIHRTDRGLAVLHAPSAAHARIMEAAGAEVAFVGTSGVVGAYTGMADVGIATMTDCGLDRPQRVVSHHHGWRYGVRWHHGRAAADRRLYSRRYGRYTD